MAVLQLNKDSFDETTKSGVSLVDFWAPWCGPCRALTPVLEELKNELGDKATIAKVNCDEETELAQKFEVRSIPALFVLKDGNVVEQFVGVQTKQQLTSAIEKALTSSVS